MIGGIPESVVEEAAVGCLPALGYTVRHGPDTAGGGYGAERCDPSHPDAVLDPREGAVEPLIGRMA